MSVIMVMVTLGVDRKTFESKLVHAYNLYIKYLYFYSQLQRVGKLLLLFISVIILFSIIVHYRLSLALVFLCTVYINCILTVLRRNWKVSQRTLVVLD